MLPLLGTHLRNNGDEQDAPHLLGASDGKDLDEALERLRHLWDRLLQLSKHGLQSHIVASLIRVHAGAATQYALRLGVSPDANIQQYDNFLQVIWKHLLGRPMNDTQWRPACLPQKLGGLGIQPAGDRAAAAFWGQVLFRRFLLLRLPWGRTPGN